MELIIKKSKPEELSIALSLLSEAAIWLRDRNIDYWQNWINPADIYVNWIKQGFDNEEFYFVYNTENVLVGMYRLQFSDEMFWGERHDKAGYIHSFTTIRNCKGQGIGYQILNEIEKELSSNDIDYMRLDCSPDIKKLCEYYEGYGFQPREIVFVAGESARLYEKRIKDD